VLYNAHVLSDEQKKKLEQYADAVSKAPSHLGLTSARDREDFFQRHVMDAVALASILPHSLSTQPTKMIDVGSGNGVPGVVLAILFPTWNVLLLDSDAKKCGFIESFCNYSLLKNAFVHRGRAEEYARSDVRETFGLAICRALGGLSTSLELLAGFVEIGGFGIVSHGTSLSEKIKNLEKIPELLGFQSEMRLYEVGDHSYSALQLLKIGRTPDLYPRRVGRPAKDPL
jgi:16S rRNA (guanine527-N7)-methyltransferase